MGIETVATPLSWFDSLPHLEKVKMGGMRQFLSRFKAYQDYENSVQKSTYLQYGDEVEFMLVDVDRSRVHLAADSVLQELRKTSATLQGLRKSTADNHSKPDCGYFGSSEKTDYCSDFAWHTEYADYMIEAVPSSPIPLERPTGNIVELSMRKRRQMIQKIISKRADTRNIVVVSLSCLPIMGRDVRSVLSDPQSLSRLLDSRTEREELLDGNAGTSTIQVARSFFVEDAVTSPHVRYQTLTRNMRLRKGARMCSLLPAEKMAGKCEPSWINTINAAFLVENFYRTLFIPGVMPLSHDDEDRRDACLMKLTRPYVWIRDSGNCNKDKTDNASDSYVYTDCQAFGAGCCCVQSTFGCKNLDQARSLYDNFLVLGPLLLALTAATPCIRGRLLATDTRWDLMSQTWDDRSLDNKEHDIIDFGRFYSPRCYLNGNKFLQQFPYLRVPSSPRLEESRDITDTSCGVTSTSCSVNGGVNNTTFSLLSSTCHRTTYEKPTLSTDAIFRNGCEVMACESQLESDGDSQSKCTVPDWHNESRYKYVHIGGRTLNDVKCACHSKGFDMLRDAGVPEEVSRHVSSLFVRDPLVVFKEKIELDDNRDLDHFNSLNSTNWTTVRLKVPEISDSSEAIPWRVEVRTPEIQMTDFENAAIVAILHILVKLFTETGLLIHMPISMVDENMTISSKKDAITSEKFWFLSKVALRQQLSTTKTHSSGESPVDCINDLDVTHEKRSLYSIFFDDEVGLLTLASKQVSIVADDHYQRYTELFRRRCAGDLLTTAQWIRRFLKQELLANQEENSDAGESKSTKKTVDASLVTDASVQKLLRFAAKLGLNLSKEDAPDLISPDLLEGVVCVAS